MNEDALTADLWDRLTPRQRVARVLMVLSEITAAGGATQDTMIAVAEGVGGFHGPPMLASSLPERPRLARQMNRAMRRVGAERFGIEPLIGANLESGLAYSLGRGGTDVPYPGALGQVSPELSYDVGRQVGLDAASCGYDWAFQPVVDVRISRDDPVIGVRTFTGGPDEISTRAVPYLQGIQSTGVLATAKHFPGHGDASVDSHHDLPVVRRDEESHRNTHLRPYQAVIAAGVGSIMSAHIVLPDLGLTEIATFCPEIGRDLLRDELGFEGILVSDSLRMRAVSDRFTRRQAVVRALTAGCDVANIKCPPGAVPGLLDELEDALARGELAESDLYRAFRRVVNASSRTVEDSSQAVLDGSGRFDAPGLSGAIRVRDEHRSLPLRVSQTASVGILVDPDGTFAEPLDGALADLSDMLGVRLVQVPGEGAPPDDVECLVVITRGQAGPTATELSLVRAAEAGPLPAAVLLAGPTDIADRCPTRLPAVLAPCIDVFGLVSRSTAYPALRARLG